MVRGAPTIVLCGVVLCVCARGGFAFGEYANRIATPIQPFAVAYVPSAQFLIMCQASDGQAGRYLISAPGQSSDLVPMFNPVSAGDAIGLAWVETEQVLYWLVETETTLGRTYRLARTTIDGWTLSPGPFLAVSPDLLLGEMTYVPSQDAFWVVDIANDRYVSFDRTTGALLPRAFDSPVRHRDARVAYGLGIEYVAVGSGYFDLLVGTLTDRRAARVIRVDLQGRPVGVSYAVDTADQSVRPGWPAGLAYCAGNVSHFTAIADPERRALVFFATPEPAAFGVTGVTSVVNETSIGPEQTSETITVVFSWTNNGAYDAINLETQSAVSGEMVTVATTQGAATSMAYEIGKEGRFLFRLTPVVGAAKAPSTDVDVRTAAGALLGITSIGADPMLTRPFAVDMIEDTNGQTLFVAEAMARPGAQNARAYRYRRTDGGAFQPLGEIAAPFDKSYVVVGLAWDSAASELVWLGLSSKRTYQFATTTIDGAPKAAGLMLIRNPFLQDQLGDIAYDAQHNVIWVVSIDRNALCSFARAADNKSFVATGAALPLPTSLPGERGTWGLPCGIALAAGPFGGSVMYVSMGQMPDNATFPQLGAGYVKRVVPMYLAQGQAPVVAGMPFDLELATGSALLRGLVVNTRATPSILIAAEDVGTVYEVRMLGEGPRFARGDANGDANVNIADVPFLLAYLFTAASPVPSCMDAADINDNGVLNLSDAIALLRHVFGIPSQVPLALPVNLCATDPVADSLSCVSYPVCQ